MLWVWVRDHEAGGEDRAGQGPRRASAAGCGVSETEARRLEGVTPEHIVPLVILVNGAWKFAERYLNVHEAPALTGSGRRLLLLTSRRRWRGSHCKGRGSSGG
jgi:hypothetical protein